MNEKLSAAIDGELSDEEAASFFAQMKGDAGLNDSWQNYHLIGDALRGDDYLNTRLTDAVMEALAEEPVVLAPHSRRKARPLLNAAMAMAASLAGVAVVSAVVWTGRSEPAVNSIAQNQKINRQVAQLTSAQISAGMQEYLVAHQTHSPSASVQGGTRYIRTVALEQGARR